MTRLSTIIVAATAASLLAGVAHAQGAFGGTDRVRDLRDDLNDAIEDDYDRLERLGNQGMKLGFDGSVALRGSATTGNDETIDLGVGANLGYYDGTNGYDLGLFYSYARSENDDGDDEVDEDRLLYDFQYSRDFNPQLYGFVKLQGSYNGDDDDGTDLERENDVFVGFGVGYRVYNTDDLQWTVQAGPGYRFQNWSDIEDTIEDFDDDDVSEVAFSISSDYLNRINETLYVTVDTDVITSDEDTVLYNDLAVNVSMSRQLALRTSLQTEYHTERAPGESATDHTLGVSLVYNFN